MFLKGFAASQMPQLVSMIINRKVWATNIANPRAKSNFCSCGFDPVRIRHFRSGDVIFL